MLYPPVVCQSAALSVSCSTVYSGNNRSLCVKSSTSALVLAWPALQQRLMAIDSPLSMSPSSSTFDFNNKNSRKVCSTCRLVRLLVHAVMHDIARVRLQDCGQHTEQILGSWVDTSKTMQEFFVMHREYHPGLHRA